jgi:hypothetical protein
MIDKLKKKSSQLDNQFLKREHQLTGEFREREDRLTEEFQRKERQLIKDLGKKHKELDKKHKQLDQTFEKKERQLGQAFEKKERQLDQAFEKKERQLDQAFKKKEEQLVKEFDNKHSQLIEEFNKKNNQATNEFRKREDKLTKRFKDRQIQLDDDFSLKQSESIPKSVSMNVDGDEKSQQRIEEQKHGQTRELQLEYTAAGLKEIILSFASKFEQVLSRNDCQLNGDELEDLSCLLQNQNGKLQVLLNLKWGNFLCSKSREGGQLRKRNEERKSDPSEQRNKEERSKSLPIYSSRRHHSGNSSDLYHPPNWVKQQDISIPLPNSNESNQTPPENEEESGTNEYKTANSNQ